MKLWYHSAPWTHKSLSESGTRVELTSRRPPRHRSQQPAEVLYRADEEGMSTSTLQRDLEGYGVTVEPFTDEDARRVEEIRRAARRESIRLSLADCCCLATAVRLDLPAVCGDQAWELLR